MLADLFRSIVDLSQQALTPPQPKTFDALCDSRTRTTAYVDKDGKLQFSQRDKRRLHTAATFDAFVDMVSKLAEPANPEIYIEARRIVAVLDEKHLDFAYLPLARSAHYRALEELPQAFSQRQSISYLRRTLRGTRCEWFAESLRNVEFSREQRSAGKSARDQESMGKSIEAQVSGTKDLPEFFTAHIAVFEPAVCPGLSTQAVEIGCDPQLQEEKFEFWLPPDELENALAMCMAELEDKLRQALPHGSIFRADYKTGKE